jgi:hypothetical protein
MFVQIAIGAISVGVVVMLGYLIVAYVRQSLPIPTITNTSCLGVYNDNATADGTEYQAQANCYGRDNSSSTFEVGGVRAGLDNSQTVVFAGFALVAVGIIVLAAFGLISVFK